MSKSELFLNIEAIAEEQIAEIQSTSHQQSEHLLTRARSKGQKLKEMALQRGKELADRDRYAFEHRAKIEALQLIENAERELLHILLAGLHEKLTSIRSNPSKYKNVLQALVKEAVEQLKLLLPDEKKFCVFADPQDKSLLKIILNEFPEVKSADISITTWGGVIVSNLSGSVLIDNRLEKRLEMATPLLTREMLERFQRILDEG